MSWGLSVLRTGKRSPPFVLSLVPFPVSSPVSGLDGPEVSGVRKMAYDRGLKIPKV